MSNIGNHHTVTLRKPWGEVTFCLGDVAYTVTAQVDADSHSNKSFCPNMCVRIQFRTLTKAVRAGGHR
jgi:hypothetical protein